MALFTKLINNFSRSLVLSHPQRTFSVSHVSRIKEFIEKKEGKTLIIEAKIVEDPKEKNLLQPASNGACLLCSAGVYVKHTDVLILSQFLRSDGRLMPRRVTGLCRTQQKRLNKLVAMSQKAGLMPNLNPPNSNRDPKKRQGFKAFNVYYDETTIEAKFHNVAWR
ncbi:28S ribosomal protein S18a, mitochondrial isoform X2 [Diachasma alloeum]|uniref:28S ribosomal protein S18a, mitochondrial isoform X1 n=1 Tax=Diachasma alloeum TaxID=454923 RepID=UPI0007383C6D|nr:28S ribosomal protein S18a, mitochondrial isoform X1 [Diachasma alloeum]XP_015120283.1 28S ribosomal protein S18a, mitochondrial isoform X2 [Diachasma alloeum]